MKTILENVVQKSINDATFLAEAEKAGYYLGPLVPADTAEVIKNVAAFVKKNADALKTQ